VNLIPYNQTDVKDHLSCPPMDHIREFQRIVVSYGVFCTIRTTMGADISGACGQLVVERDKKSENSYVDIEDLQSNHDKGFRDIKPAKREKHVETRSTKKSQSEKNYSEKWIRPLMLTTAISASCCLASSIALIWIKKRR
jgi:hypothetical protein